MKRRIVKHGEAVFVEARIPSDIQDFAKVELTSNNSVNNKLIVAESETSGNHHLLEVAGADVRQQLEELYIMSSSDLQVSCLHEGRHDAAVLPKAQPGHLWVRRIAKEFDYLNQEVRNVAD